MARAPVTLVSSEVSPRAFIFICPRQQVEEEETFIQLTRLKFYMGLSSSRSSSDSSLMPKSAMMH